MLDDLAGLGSQERRHWASLNIREGAISASPEKLGLKEKGNSCSVPPPNNRDSESESHLSDLMTDLPWERV